MAYSKSFVRDGETFPYNESLDEEGYVYNISVNWKNKDAEVWITNDGVSVSFDDKTVITSVSIVPEELFKAKNSLTEDQLYDLLNLMSSSEGEKHTVEEMETFYQEYLNETTQGLK